MCHRTGFTEERLGKVIIAAGFNEARVLKGRNYDLWALGLMANADREHIETLVSANGTRFPSLRHDDLLHCQSRWGIKLTHLGRQIVFKSNRSTTVRLASLRNC